MFRKVTGTMFSLAKHYESYWQKKPNRWKAKYYRECFSQYPIPVKINIDDMKKSFQNEFHATKELYTKFLPDELIRKVDHLIQNSGNFDAVLWADVVYQYAAAYKRVTTEEEKYLLLDTLKTLWLGRFVSYARQVEGMNVNGAEKVIQEQAEIFEDRFEYLKSIY